MKLDVRLVQHPIARTGLLLMVFALVGAALVAGTYVLTSERIAVNEHQALLRQLYQVVDPAEIDNDLVSDQRLVSDPLLGGQPLPVHLGRKQGQPVVAVYEAVAPDGYSGRIRLLVAVRADNRLGGVRVLDHRETPGLGDRIDERRSDWILQFNGLSLLNPIEDRWKVRKDGGDFDQFTGATITPRAVVGAVKGVLLYHRDQGAALFKAPTGVDQADDTGGGG